jgi:hypothetical protein
MQTFPALPSLSKPDSSQFSYTVEDPSMGSETEGGYKITRARFRRTKLRRSWPLKYTMLTNSDRLALENFYNLVRGGSEIFQWTNPQDDLVYLVRFEGELKFGYEGIGLSQRWNCSFTLAEA